MSNVVFFDGVDDYVSIADNVVLRLTSPFTIIIRAKLIKATGQQYLLGATANKFGILYGWTANSIQFQSVGYAGGDPNGALMVLSPNSSWHHIVYSADNTVPSWKGFVDGNRIVNLNTNFTLPGGAATVYIANASAFLGSMVVAEVQIYNRQLSDEEISYNNAHPNNPKRRGLVLNLTQDSIYGPTWLDLSGNANNGTYVGGAVPQVANRLSGR